MANLLESYKNRLAISESIHQKSHNGAKMSAAKKLMIATVLNNTSKFMNEAFDSAAATQRSALGDYKKFCLNISTVALPNLILPELMLTQPMTSITGFVTYLKYTAGTTKGGVEAGKTVFGDVFKLGQMDENRVNYTSDRIVEKIEADATKVVWGPVNLKAGFKFLDDKNNVIEGGSLEADGTFVAPEGATKIAYVYDNTIVPQKGANSAGGADIATLTASMDAVQLYAHARRIAVYYSQIAAFQAKTDYGYDLAEQLSTQAQGELAYEIDTEGVLMLVNGAEFNERLSFPAYEVAIKATVNGTYLSRSQYYEQFSEIIARAKQVLYKRTQKFAPNYMIVGSNVLTIMPYLKGWTAASVGAVNGPYMAGTVDGLKVFVSPAIDENEIVFGVNGSDLQTSAAVYAPYMAIVPTQLLGFADGTMSQGFSTMYDMKLLSTYDIVNGERVDAKEGATGQYSYLLVKGAFDVDGKYVD